MNQTNGKDNLIKPTEEIQLFPLRKLYFIVISILTILSLLGLSVQTDNISSGSWKLSANISVGSITLTLLLLIWLPMLIPWIVHLSPRLREFVTGLREGGIEEIEAGILRIKLSADVKNAAESYGNKILEPTGTSNPTERSLQDLDKSYRETLAVLDQSVRLEASEAIKRIDQLCLYYDRVRETMQSGSKRTRLMTDIASTMWALLPSIPNFPVRQRLNSILGGERLSAYKFLEWQAGPNYLELLLSRAMGILEVPFGQYNALLALRRVVANSQISTTQRDLILQSLRWNIKLEFLGQDRRFLMQTIISALEQKTQNASQQGS